MDELHRADELAVVVRGEQHARPALELREQRLVERARVVDAEPVHEADRVAAVDGVGKHARQLVERLRALRRVEPPHLHRHGPMLRPETTRPPLGETLHEEAAREQRDPDGEEARRPGE